MLKNTAIFGWNSLSEWLLKAIDQKLSTIRISKSENLPAFGRFYFNQKILVYIKLSCFKLHGMYFCREVVSDRMH